MHHLLMAPNPLFQKSIFHFLIKTIAWFFKYGRCFIDLPHFIKLMSVPVEDYLLPRVKDPRPVKLLVQALYSGSAAAMAIPFLDFFSEYYYPAGGVQQLPNLMADYIKENGGEIRTGNLVKELVVKDWKARSVVVDGDKGLVEITAPFYVCNIPAYGIYNILDEDYFPLELRDRIASFYPLGALLGNICLKEPLETNFPKGQWLINLPGIEDLDVFGGKLCFGFEQTSVVDPSRTPDDR